VSGAAGRLAYKPVGLVLGVVAGATSGFLVRQIWRRISGDDEAPTVADEERGWAEILGAAALQGAIFALVKAAVEKGGATGTRRVTGTWPL